MCPGLWSESCGDQQQRPEVPTQGRWRWPGPSLQWRPGPRLRWRCVEEEGRRRRCQAGWWRHQTPAEAKLEEVTADKEKAEEEIAAMKSEAEKEIATKKRSAEDELSQVKAKVGR